MYLWNLDRFFHQEKSNLVHYKLDWNDSSGTISTTNAAASFGQFGSWVSFLLGQSLPAQHIPNQLPEDKVRYQPKELITLAYPVSFCMIHTKRNWKLSNKTNLASGGPMWFWRTVHALIEIFNRKGFKKSKSLHRQEPSISSMIMVELLHVLELRLVDFRKAIETQHTTRYLVIFIVSPWNRSTLD